MSEVVLHRRRDLRVFAYAIIGAASLLFALFTARVEMAAFGTPFVMALVLARRTSNDRIGVAVVLDEQRAIEGDVVSGRVIVTNRDPQRAGATVELLMAPSFDLTPVTPGATDPMPGDDHSWEVTAGGPDATTVPFALRAERWGSFVVGPTAVRLRDPHALTYWEGVLPSGPSLIALPVASRLDSLLEPRSSRTTAGFHLARRALGHGMDFAELQDYRPGDRLRDLNRAATARAGRAIVNRYHPERAGEVVVLLDTYIDPSYELSATSRQAIVVSVRAAWAIARAHLGAQDRVGVATVGRIPVWLSPAGGVRARYQLLEAMLSVGAALDGDQVRNEPVDAGRVPPAALVVFISPLWDDRYLPHVQYLQARGRETAVIHIGIDHLIAPPATPDAHAAYRLFAITVDDRVERLRRAGINVVRWERGASLDAIVSAAAQRQAHRRTASAGAR